MNKCKRACLVAALLIGGGVAHADRDGSGSGVGEWVLELSAGDGSAIPAIGLPPGRLVTIAFHDARGVPWPTVQVEGPEAGWLSYRPASEHRHVVFVEGRGRRGSGNLVALLDGLAVPVHLGLVADASAVATRVEVRLADARAAPASGADSTTGAGVAATADMEAVIRDYLLSHPEVLREALDPARQLVSRAREHRAELLAGEGVPLLGDAAGAVTVVEFFDYRCGYCKRSLEAVRAMLSRAGVRLQMREYPILGEDSERAARMALAAARQGAYGEAHFALMAHEGDFDAASLEGMAVDLGLDPERLRRDMASPEVGALIEANRELAERLGVTGTPAFLVLGPGGVEISPGLVDTERLNALIDSAG